MRATARMAGVSKNTVKKLLCDLGEACEAYQRKHLIGLRSERVQCDEVWSFCYAKEKNVPERFKDQFGSAMDDDAWAGWAAMKLLADTIVRQPALAGEDLMEELKTNLAFDGQKGIDMSFRETGQLRQPLLLIDADEIVGEAPVRGIVDSSNLDSLGVPFCTK